MEGNAGRNEKNSCILPGDENGGTSDASNTTHNFPSNGDAMNLMPLLSIRNENKTGELI